MLQFLIDAFIIIWAVILLIGGINNIWRPRKIIKERALKKKKDIVEPTSKKIIFTRFDGAVQLFLALVIIFSGRFSIGWGSSPEVSIVVSDGEFSNEVEYFEIIDSYAKEHDIPGLIVGIIDDDGSALFGYGYEGYSLLKGNKPIDEDTLFEIGSITKTFTGVMLAQGVQSGRLELETSASRFLESYSEREILLDEDVTLKMLATHTSGLPRIPFNLRTFISTYSLGITRGNPYKSITEEVMIDYFKNLQDIKSKEQYRYSNYGFGLLGLIVSESNNMTYEEAMIDLIAKELSMNSTIVHADETKKSKLAKGHNSFIRIGSFNIGRQSQYWDMHDAMAGCGGIRSSGKDMMKYLEGMINQNLQFSELSKQPLLSINENRDIAMGWMIQDNIVENQKVIWHNGQTGGFNSYIGFTENQNKGVVILSNLATKDVLPLGEEILIKIAQ